MDPVKARIDEPLDRQPLGRDRLSSGASAIDVHWLVLVSDCRLNNSRLSQKNPKSLIGLVHGDGLDRRCRDLPGVLRRGVPK